MNVTEFQKLIIFCEPEVNKPVFVLTGRGCGKTVALNERATYKKFLYFSPISSEILKMFKFHNNLNIGKDIHGYDEIVFENYTDPELILRLIKIKKLIIFTNGVDFVADFGNKLKGEYKIISGYNVYDNPYVLEENSNYVEILKSLSLIDRKRLFLGDY